MSVVSKPMILATKSKSGFKLLIYWNHRREVSMYYLQTHSTTGVGGSYIFYEY